MHAARARGSGALGRGLGGSGRRGRGTVVVKPRVLFVSRERHRLPLPEVQRRKWDALSDRLEVRVLAAAQERQPPVDDRFVLVAQQRPKALDGALFYAELPT